MLAGHLAHVGAQDSFSQNRYRTRDSGGCAGLHLATLPIWDDKRVVSLGRNRGCGGWEGKLETAGVGGLPGVRGAQDGGLVK